ncbi:hypothetical protein [Leifsonia sp. AG29]|uniref:hypothetical protein n=1 Tax=Leifsonia sp. AG29 TaxID=2598860 RepID=UPI00131C3723|nr:hypothetical protein [Leifsonia sp. AG29]
MTDRTDQTPDAAAEPRDADELSAALSELGESPEDRLETVAERNDSLEERLPSADDLPRTEGAPGQG